MSDAGAGGGFLIAEAFVQVNPLLTGFGAKLAAQLNAQMKMAGATAGNTLGSQVKKGAKEGEEAVQSLSQKVGNLGKETAKTGGPVKALGLAFAGLFVIKGLADAIKDAREFQMRLVDLQTGAGETAGNLGMIASGLKNMSGEVGVSSINLEKALYTIESDGFHGAAGLNILHAAAEGARTGLADVSTVAQSVMTVMRSYEIPANKATQATSMLVEAVAHGGVRMDEMALGMKTVAPLASALHIPITQLYGAMATMTSVTHDAATAATGLRFVMNSLAAPTNTAQGAMEDVGLSAELVANTLQGPGHLIGTLQLIEKHVGETFPNDAARQIAALHDIVGGTRGMTAALQLMGPHLQEMIANTNGIGEASKGAGKDVNGWSAVNKTLDFQIEQIKAKTGAWAITIGTALIPVLTDMLKWLQTGATAIIDSAKWLDHHRAVVAALGLAILAIEWNSMVTGMFAIAHAALEAAGAMMTFGADSAGALALANPIIGGAAIALGAVIIATQLLGHSQHDTKVDVDSLTAAIKAQNDGNRNAVPNAFLKQLEDNTIASRGETYIEFLKRYNINAGALVATLTKSGPGAVTIFKQAQHEAEDYTALMEVKGPAAHNQLIQMIAPVLKDPAASDNTKFKLLKFLTDLSTKYTALTGQTAKNKAAQDTLTKALTDYVDNATKMDNAQKLISGATVESGKEVTKQFPIWDGYTAKIKLNGKTLLDNLQQEVNAIAGEGANIQKLYQRGFDPSIIQSLVAKGPEYVAAANSLTDQQLSKLSGIFGNRYNAATSLAGQIAFTGGGKNADDYIKGLQGQAGAGSASARKLLAGIVDEGARAAMSEAGLGGARVTTTWFKSLSSKRQDALQAAINTLPDPIQQAVRTALHIAGDGGRQLPPTFATGVNSNKLKAIQAADDLRSKVQAKIDALHGKTIDVVTRDDASAALGNIDRVAGDVSRAFSHLFAAGGPATGGVPGKDSVPSLLMPGEHVWTTAEVDAAGGHGAMYALRKAVLSGRVTGYADGGPVDVGKLSYADQQYYRAVYNATPLVDRLTSKYGRLAAPGPTSSGFWVGIGQVMAGARGWGGAEFSALNSLWTRESGWNPYAVNPNGGAYGIPQAYPPAQGHPYALGDGYAQIAWGLDYIKSRYGDPMAAWATEVRINSYDQGGPLMPGWTMAWNGTGRPEQVGAAAGVVNNNSFTIVLDKSMSNVEMIADVQRRLALAVAR